MELRDLTSLSEDSSLTIMVGNKFYDNIRIWTFHLKNIGLSPITPDDFIRPVIVSVDSPWKIIKITNYYLFSSLSSDGIVTEWRRISPTKMALKPILLNLGDSIYQTVYVTSTEFGPNSQQSEVNKLHEEKDSLNVTARIINLSHFTDEVDFLEQVSSNSITLIYLTLFDTVFLVIIASVLLYIYIQLLLRSGMAAFPSRNFVIAVVFLSILSFSTAEVITYYVFGGEPVLMYFEGRRFFDWHAQFQNWLVLALHLLCSSFLYVRVKRELTATGEVG